ncbi:MAG: NBR1-Ig-like domain-containing protein [Anaerolineae bacterium]
MTAPDSLLARLREIWHSGIRGKVQMSGVGLLAICVICSCISFVSSTGNKGSATTGSGSPPALALAPTVAPATAPTVTPTIVQGGGGGVSVEVQSTPVPAGGAIAASGASVANDTPVPEGCLSASFVSDVTIPDHTHIAGSQSFEKTWRVRNSGQCDWPAGVSLNLKSGDRLGSGGAIPVPPIKRGEEANISVSMKAPQTAGSYTSEWQFQAPKGTPFGDSFTAVIEVDGPARLVDVLNIVGKPAANIEATWGPSIETYDFGPGDVEGLPNGGQARTYRQGQYTFGLLVDKKGLVTQFQILDGLAGERIPLDQWSQIVPRFGLDITTQPDKKAPAAWYWDNFKGKKVVVIANGLPDRGGVIWTVQVYQLQ